MQPLTETQLHELARKRVDFRCHLLVYCIINAALWMIWFVTGAHYPWPVWPMVGWGIGVIFHYLFDYRSSKFFSEEEEYKKLRRNIPDDDKIVQ
jgi:2TM domain